MIYVQNRLSFHALHLEDVTQQHNQEYPGLHQHLTGLVQETQHFREMLEESRTAQPAAGPEIDRRRQREAELLREVRRQTYDTAKFDALLFRNRTNLQSRESRTSECQQIIRDLRSEVVHMKASAVPPNLTGRLEAKAESQTYETQSLPRNQQTTQDSLNNWDEVNFRSVQPKVCVDEGVATSTSSVSRSSEPAISHLPQAGGDPELFLQREHTMPKTASNCSS